MQRQKPHQVGYRKHRRSCRIPTWNPGAYTCSPRILGWGHPCAARTSVDWEKGLRGGVRKWTIGGGHHKRSALRSCPPRQFAKKGVILRHPTGEEVIN